MIRYTLDTLLPLLASPQSTSSHQEPSCKLGLHIREVALVEEADLCHIAKPEVEVTVS